MRLSEMVEQVGLQAMRRFIEKRGGVMPVALGFNAVDVMGRAKERSKDVRSSLDRATYETLAPDVAKHAGFTMMDGGHGGGHGSPSKGPPSFGGAAHEGFGKGLGSMASMPLGGAAKGLEGVMGEGMKRLFFGREMGEKKDPLSMIGAGAATQFGKTLGTMGAELLQDMASKAVSAMGSVGTNAARSAIIDQLKKDDPVLSTAQDATLMEAYHTMVRFAPVLSTDKNAVRSFLRQAVMSGSGVDFASIKLLAESERAVTHKDKE